MKKTKKTKDEASCGYPHLDRIDLEPLLEDRDYISIWQGSYTNGTEADASLNIQEESKEHVDHPTHYHAESGIEVIDAIEAWGLNFTLGNVIKYVARSGHKHDAREDLQKALWYLTHELSKYES